jgi:hypothetical protein
MRRLARIAALAITLAALTTAVALASGGLSGTFKTKIKGDSALGGHLNGTWTITFKNGTYKVTDDGHPITSGKYAITGSNITFKGEHGANSCPKTGKYKFKLEDKTLKFTKISDSNSSQCAGRVGVLAHTFTKVS